ncbi:DUF1285 domain-containing protein [Dinoroseobacter sp. S124A]|uniref:DUF1285 domain-containing protein n=1 Tax=Dinoroseobacter sp. S124A TaxID=3415128 RepID=UPI003C7CDA5F
MAKTMSAQNIVTPTADDLAVSAQAASKQGPPPVHLWNPPFCGDLDIHIARDGNWSYQGSPISRAPLVRLFSSILKLEDGKYFLVTPVEKVGITVEDAPFVATDFEVSEEDGAQVLTFTTQVGDTSRAGVENPIRVSRDPGTGEPAPYIHIRRGLEALIDRKSFYRLVELGETAEIEGTEWFGLRSEGVFFPMIPAAELQGV